MFSPSCDIDPAYDEIKKYVKNKLEPDYEWCFSEYDPEVLDKVIEDQTKLMKAHKEGKLKGKPFQCCVIIDDFSDSPEFTRNSKQLWALYARGRHQGISTFTLTQRWRALSPIVRLNASVVFAGRMRNTKDIIALAEELSGSRGVEALREAISTAVSDAPYSYLKIDLMAPVEKAWRIRMDGSYL